MSRRRTALVELEDAAIVESVVGALHLDGYEVYDSGSDLPSTLDLLVVDTPVPPAGDFLESDVQRWYDDVRAAVSRPFRLVHAATPALRRSGDARVVVLGSGWIPTSLRASAAAVAHGAVVGLVKTLARDLGPQGITVNEVVLHPFDPPRPEDVARTVAYLGGTHGGAITGQLITLGSAGELRP
ncbi:SDR family oxidoreductase [Ornithinimicrobium sediminis]|uniref:SDR family oxidoreductase n=1 Tax=Ornithinimicrobium sediminis TaxID=2904603 RepID=UPI001E57D3B6|nr:SDR family oxidoreductase [Ornithinimicrobium sediminis]MCE0488276.1 SDR family oxidoreductase [Ornithinimicrobium sediminis]